MVGHLPDDEHRIRSQVSPFPISYKEEENKLLND